MVRAMSTFVRPAAVPDELPLVRTLFRE